MTLLKTYLGVLVLLVQNPELIFAAALPQTANTVSQTSFESIAPTPTSIPVTTTFETSYLSTFVSSSLDATSYFSAEETSQFSSSIETATSLAQPAASLSSTFSISATSSLDATASPTSTSTTDSYAWADQGGLSGSDIGAIVSGCVLAVLILVCVTIYGIKSGNPMLVFQFIGAVLAAAFAVFLCLLQCVLCYLDD